MDITDPESAQVVDWIATHLVQGSLQGALLVAMVWMICRSTTLTARVRAVLWWMVSLKLVLTFVPLPSVPLPLLPASQSFNVAATAAAREPESLQLAALDDPSSEPVDDASASTTQDQPSAVSRAALS